MSTCFLVFLPLLEPLVNSPAEYFRHRHTAARGLYGQPLQQFFVEIKIGSLHHVLTIAHVVIFCQAIFMWIAELLLLRTWRWHRRV